MIIFEREKIENNQIIQFTKNLYSINQFKINIYIYIYIDLILIYLYLFNIFIKLFIHKF